MAERGSHSDNLGNRFETTESSHIWMSFGWFLLIIYGQFIHFLLQIVRHLMCQQSFRLAKFGRRPGAGGPGRGRTLLSRQVVQLEVSSKNERL